MADTQVKIQDFIQDPEVTTYYQKIQSILETIQGHLQDAFKMPDAQVKELKEQGKFMEEWTGRFAKSSMIIFGGFVRDIIQGIPANKLKEKDVDVLVEEISNISHERLAYIVRYLKEYLTMYKSVDVDWDHNVFFEDISHYGLVKLKIDGIRFDLSFDVNCHGRFDRMHDFACNSLFFDIPDGILATRYRPLSVKECIDDIRNLRLRDMSKCTEYAYNGYSEKSLDIYRQQMIKRKRKMLSYGYSLCVEEITPI